MFKQQNTKVLQYAQVEQISEKKQTKLHNLNPQKTQNKTKKTKQNKSHPPHPLFNSKMRYGSSLLNFLKQTNKIPASTISNMPNNAILYFCTWKKLLI